MPTPPPGASRTAAAAAAQPARYISSDSIPAGGFTPGTILAERYRVIGLLGRGGMGEVYRADDLKLGQAVALKFLPRALASDPVRRERFFAEVRITRQLAHPNICRVYDIAEAEGQHFLSMEYIDGEDLASLIKRIGRLSDEKAMEIARQLIAGLAAAQDRGVLHRDLKPANIMIDGHGRVRITDFGLAIATGDETLAAEAWGTPAYMAPEQLAGKGASVRSDIYALGLVLYEIYCGRKAFTAGSIAELREQKESSTPKAPSEIRSGFDPAVERVIMRCLDRDPKARPASAAQLAVALPGGDPLAAAIAAGETPSPEMVAAAGVREGVHPAFAVALLAIVVVGAIANVWLLERTDLFLRVKPPKPPAALIERAQEHVKRAGYGDAPVDSASGFQFDQDFVAYLGEKLRSGAANNIPEALGVQFWYRQSPRPLVRPPVPLGEVGVDSPPMKSGDVVAVVDINGRLRMLQAIPPETRPDGEATQPPDWDGLFAGAGLDRTQWKSVSPKLNPAAYADALAAWEGVLPEAPGLPMHIEAAAYRGQPVSFQIVSPWKTAEGSSIGGRGDAAIGLLTLFSVIGGAVYLTRKNLRMGRGDRRGAVRLMLVVQAAMVLGWVFTEHHVPTIWEVALIVVMASLVLLIGGLCWVLYLAFEPFVRRRRPEILTSWTRLLSGEWRDPLLGRDLLAGCAAGVAAESVFLLRVMLSRYDVVASTGDVDAVSGFGGLLSRFTTPVLVGIFGAFAYLLLFVLLRMLLRNDWLAIATLLAVRDLSFLAVGASWIQVTSGLAVDGLLLFVLMRFGLLGGIAMGIIEGFFLVPMTIQTSAWYAAPGFVALFLIAAISLYAFRTSLGNRPALDLSAD
jgi:serine/threonine-protein kinase